MTKEERRKLTTENYPLPDDEVRQMYNQVISHCMSAHDATIILTLAGIGCDVLSPDGFICWLKEKMRRDWRLGHEYYVRKAICHLDTTNRVDENILKANIAKIREMLGKENSSIDVDNIFMRCKTISECSTFTVEQIVDLVIGKVRKGCDLEDELNRLEEFYHRSME